MILTEKILARAAGRKTVSPGEIITCHVDLVCIDEIQFPIFENTLKKLGSKEVDRERTVVVRDHYCPPTSLDQARASLGSSEHIPGKRSHGKV